VIEAIKARLAKATPGPWEAAKKSVCRAGTQQDYGRHRAAPSGYQGGICNRLGEGYGSSVNATENKQAEVNADFLVHTPEDIAYLLARVEAVE